MAHDFFYRGVATGETRNLCRCSLHYDGPTVYSYWTVVGRVIPTAGLKDGDVQPRNPNSGMLLLSMYSMTSSTRKHLSYLRGASPFKIVEVPMHYGDRSFSPETLKKNLLNALGEAAEDLNHADGRRKFAALKETLYELRSFACKEWADAARGKEFRRFDTLDVDKAMRELHEQRRKDAAKRAAEVRAVLKKYRVGEDNYCEFAHTVFGKPYQGRGFEGITDEELSILANRLVKSGKAYVWPDVPGDVVATSKGIRISMQEARLALRAWASGKDMRKYNLDGYTVLYYTGDTIKIGCHEIPWENMLSLYREVMGKPFPAKPSGETAA